MKQANETGPARRALVGGTLTFQVPYGGRATFDWRLDAFGHDVLVECVQPWKGLHTDVHRMGMGPKFTPREARQLAEVLARRIIDNLEFVIANRSKDDVRLESFYDNQQLPLYRKWAWEEEKRRAVEVGLLAESFRDDDEDDDEDDAMSARYEERAEEELRKVQVEVVAEVGD